MQYMSGNEIREKFIAFFESKGHKRMPSASLVPDDPSLLLTIAGMVPFKPFFLGKAVPPSVRMTTSQKCVRTNDLDNVGRTARHHTFFEMLGNFSVGDYFKAQVIPWAWEFLTQVLEIPAERLFISVYEDDQEAYNMWHDSVGIPVERILRLGKDDNFWEMGATGPCGPCSEIYYDFGPSRGCGSPDCAPGCDCDRYIEIWNLVFMQFNRDDKGVLEPLPQKNIDTGMGLERITAVMQNVKTNFDTDLILPLINLTEEISGRKYLDNAADDMAFRVIADHVRSTVFMICDGIQPSNEGRGYVLRRILRRAVRYGKLLGIEESFLEAIVRKEIEIMSGAYPDLHDRADHIVRVIKTEEDRFMETLETGINLLNQKLALVKAAGETSISGEDIFKLYDTYGFPFEMTKEIAEEESISLDEDGFKQAMEEQKQRARSARSGEGSEGSRFALNELLDKSIPETEFVGKRTLESSAKVLAIVKGSERVKEIIAGDSAVIVTAVTPFYAESGGQTGDKGIIKASGLMFEVDDVKKLPNGKIVHYGHVAEGHVHEADDVIMMVDAGRRKETSAAHSATHLLQKSLQIVLGDHVHQAGSLVTPGYLRFDFSHISAMTDAELMAVEDMVNRKIRENINVTIQEMPIDEAKATGATALFGEKYGETVYVVTAGDFSRELCGGTHVSNTGSIGMFKLLSESGIAAGVRRIEAYVGDRAFAYVRELESRIAQAGSLLKCSSSDVIDRLEAVLVSLKEKEREISDLNAKLASGAADELADKVIEVLGIKIIAARVDGLANDDMRLLTDKLRDKAQVIVLAGAHEDKVSIVAAADKHAISKGVHAGKLVKEIAAAVGGGGGGKPDMAQAGGRDISKIDQALALAAELVAAQLK